MSRIDDEIAKQNFEKRIYFQRRQRQQKKSLLRAMIVNSLYLAAFIAIYGGCGLLWIYKLAEVLR